MSEELYLTPETEQKLQMMAAELERRMDEGRSRHRDDDEQIAQGSEVYVAMHPCGESIPALDKASGTPGRNDDCCIFRVVQNDVLSNERKLERIDDVDGGPDRKTVFNIYETEFRKDETYFEVRKHKSGAFLCEKPEEAVVSSGTTSTTTTTSQNCDGSCQWEWNGTTWVKQTDGCYLITTTWTRAT